MAEGLRYVWACDIRIAAEKARLGLQEPKFGLVPGIGMYRLPRMINFGWALELLLTGDLIPASEALRIGIVNQVVPFSELMPAALRMAERILTCAPLAVQAIKESAYRSHDMSLRDALAAKFGPLSEIPRTSRKELEPSLREESRCGRENSSPINASEEMQ